MIIAYFNPLFNKFRNLKSNFILIRLYFYDIIALGKVGLIMKLKRFITAALIIVLALSAVGCSSNKTGINILEQDKDYAGPFDMPSLKKVEHGSALWVLASLNENGYKVKSASKTKSDDPSILESYKINCYDVYIELFNYQEDSEKLKEIVSSGKYTIYGNGGAVIKEYPAYVNGPFVLFFSADKDFNGNDKTEENAKLAQLFTSLDRTNIQTK